MIVTLAGHVDHGKTSLVQCLTGVDTDRLAEEKARGLTIDLGFAYIDEGRLGFVDVPGHHKFIHNMVAGVASQQYALLVIAADDGPMPQSREHLDILQLVGVQAGAIALTKIDRVDTHRLQAVQAEIEQLTAGTFLANAEIFPCCNLERDTTHALLDHLRAQAEQQHSSNAEQPFRMALDRVFSVRGAGVVVTGTIHSGTVAVDQTLTHFPSHTPVRVRGIRAQDQEAPSAGAGSRCALNISGLNLQDIRRGDWLNATAQENYLEIAVQLRVLGDFPRAVKHWTPIHIYHATSHSTGRLALLDEQRLQPGTEDIVHVVCDAPLGVRHGDRLIIRDQSLDVTLGGARVIWAAPEPMRRRRRPNHRAALQACLGDDPEISAAQQLEDTGVLPITAFKQLWNLDRAGMDRLLGKLDGHQHDDNFVSSGFWQAHKTRALEQLNAHTMEQPSSPGLRSNGFAGLPRSLASGVLNELVAEKKMTNQGGIYQLPEQKVELPPALARSWQQLEQALDNLQAPSTGDLAKQWRHPQQNIERDLKELTKRGLVIHVANHRFYLPRRLNELAKVVEEMTSAAPLAVKAFRDQTGVGRNIAIEVLEYFDRRGYTRRQDNERILLRKFDGF
ncbi:MAG: selenocysteine-specific translation elongation factor [Pseudomonadota bacterium]